MENSNRRKVRKDSFYLIVSIFLPLLLLSNSLVSCASNPPAHSPIPPMMTQIQQTSVPMQTAAISAEPYALKTYTFKAVDSHPPTGAAAVTFDFFARRVKEVTNGLVKIECYHSSSLVGANDTLNAVRNGLIDFGWTPLSYTHGQMPFSEWANNVPYYVVDADQVKLFYSRTLPLMNDEFKKKDWPIRAFATTSGLCEWFFKTSQDPDNPNWQGLEVRSAGEPWTSLITILGGSPVSAPVNETFLLASTGLINASTGALSSYNGMGLYEVLPYVWISGWRNFAAPFMVNTNSLNRLPADLRQKIEEVFPEVSDFNMNFVKENDEAVIARMKQKSKSVIIFTPDQRKILIDKIRPVYDKSISQFESNGYPAKEWMNWLESLSR